jgi:hypothetical protein
LAAGHLTQKEEIMDSITQNQRLVELVQQMKWHWSLERVASTSFGERWCVFDTDTGNILSDAASPEEALIHALEPQKYVPQYRVDENTYASFSNKR